MAALASLPALPFNAPLALSLSAEEKWGQKVPLRAQHNKTKAAQRSVCQPAPFPGVDVEGLQWPEVTSPPRV